MYSRASGEKIFESPLTMPRILMSKNLVDIKNFISAHANSYDMDIY